MENRTIPLCDISDFNSGNRAREERFVRNLGDGLAQFGFFRITNHGISKPLIEASLYWGAQFFDLQETSKLRYLRPETGGLIGYLTLDEGTRDQVNADALEMWHINSTCVRPDPTLPQNVWPDELPGLRPTYESLYAAFEEIAQLSLQAASLYLDCDRAVLPAVLEGGWTTLRMMRYPSLPQSSQPGDIRVKPHEDTSLLTILSAGSASGLQVLEGGASWIPVEDHGHELIVGGGKMLSRLTGNRLRAGVHRVLYTEKKGLRVSTPFFVVPNPATVLTSVLNDAPPLPAPITTAQLVAHDLGIGIPV